MEIVLKNLSFSYKKDKQILSNINYCFCSGNCYVVKGENGTGKTTLSKLLCGLLSPKKEMDFIDGEDISTKNLISIAQKIGYLYQNPDLHFFCETVEKELAFPFIINDKYNESAQRTITKIMEDFKLEGLQERFPLLLSTGEKQRLALATIFIRDIAFVILDEPTSALDSQGQAFLSEVINKFVSNGGGAIVITHDDRFQSLLCNVTELMLKDGDFYEN